MNCFQAKAGQVAPQWFVIDASDQVVGRLAAQIAPILMGKHRPTYTPHIDTGDFVIVTNVEKVVFTGKKWEQQTYQRYSGYPGGQTEEVAWKLHKRRPDRVLHEAIRRMMPKNKIGRHMMAKLKLVVGPHHPHQAQQPIPLAAKSGRPAASGIILAPERVVNPPRRLIKKREESLARKAARDAQLEAGEATPTAATAVAEAPFTAPAPTPEPEAPTATSTSEPVVETPTPASEPAVGTPASEPAVETPAEDQDKDKDQA